MTLVHFSCAVLPLCPFSYMTSTPCLFCIVSCLLLNVCTILFNACVMLPCCCIGLVLCIVLLCCCIYHSVQGLIASKLMRSRPSSKRCSLLSVQSFNLLTCLSTQFSCAHSHLHLFVDLFASLCPFSCPVFPWHLCLSSAATLCSGARVPWMCL